MCSVEMISVSVAVGFNGGRLPHKEIRVGATDGRKYRGCLKGETTVSHFICMCWVGKGLGGGGEERREGRRYCY